MLSRLQRPHHVGRRVDGELRGIVGIMHGAVGGLAVDGGENFRSRIAHPRIHIGHVQHVVRSKGLHRAHRERGHVVLRAGGHRHRLAAHESRHPVVGNGDGLPAEGVGYLPGIFGLGKSGHDVTAFAHSQPGDVIYRERTVVGRFLLTGRCQQDSQCPYNIQKDLFHYSYYNNVHGFVYAKTRGRKVFSFSTAKGFLFQPLRAQRTQREKYFASFRLGVQKTLRSSRSLRLTNKNLRVFPSLRTNQLRISAYSASTLHTFWLMARRRSSSSLITLRS